MYIHTYIHTGLEDSGIGNMLLESPCISDLESPCNNHIKSQITQLESYPLSPDKESYVYFFY